MLGAALSMFTERTEESTGAVLKDILATVPARRVGGQRRDHGVNLELL